MSKPLLPAMQRALAAARDLNPAEATRIIRQALGVSGDTAQHDVGRLSGRVAQPQPGPQPRSGKPSSRHGLGETLEILREMKGRLGTDGLSIRPAPQRDDLTTRSFACRSGRRDYRLFLPAEAPYSGLILMLHGCKQTPDDFALGTGMNEIAARHNLIVAYPWQTASANGSCCWNWFRPHDQEREGGEAEILAGITQSLVEQYRLPPLNVFVAGLSAGGAMAAVMGATYPDIFAAAGVHSGLPYRSAHDVNSAFAAMRGQNHSSLSRAMRHSFLPRLIVFHGRGDQTVSDANAKVLWESAMMNRDHGEVITERIVSGGRAAEHRRVLSATSEPLVEEWIIEQSGHCWSGGDRRGSYADPHGPNASAEMVRFFLRKTRSAS